MRVTKRLLMFGWLLSLLGIGSAPACGDTPTAVAPLGSQPTAALPAGKGDSALPGASAGACPAWSSPFLTGHLDAGAADEVSALVASRQQPGVLWAVEDKGNAPTLFATDRRGRDLGRWTLVGAKNRDWEALSLGPGLPGGPDVLYVADMGDNGGTRESARIFRLEEPRVDAAASWSLDAQGPRVDVMDYEELKLVHADGVPRNVEAFVVDPVDGAAWAISRARDGEETVVLRVVWPEVGPDAGAEAGLGALEVALTEADAPGLRGEVVAADASADAVAVLFKSGAVRVWRREGGEGLPETLLDTLRRAPCEGPGGAEHTRALALTGGEGPAWPPSWVLVPEGKHAPLTRVEPAAPCPVAGEVELAGTVREASATELSGVVASRRQDVLWAHNDGDRNTLMALKPSGEVLAIFWLEGDPAVDWEDIALGPGPDPARDYVYVADIGDNKLDRKHVQVLRFPEPAVDGDLGAEAAALSDMGVQPITDYEVFALEYPGKAEHDAEGLLVDPVDGTVYIFTKRNHDDDETRLYAARTLNPEAKVDLELVLTEAQAEHLHGAVTAADVTPQGDWAGLLTRYGEARFWFRPVGTGTAPLWEALQHAPCRGPIAPGQVESLSFSRARDGYWMLPEGEEPGVFFVPFVE